MGNWPPHRHRSAQGEEEAQSKSDTAHPHADIQSLAWKFANDPHVCLDNTGHDDDDDDDDVTFDDDDNDDAHAESDDNDGMFHGLFYLGSEVLTEVEMQSPVEESKIVATPVRTPRRSNNSSRASSTRELDVGSSQVCFVDYDLCPSSDATAVVSPGQYAPQSVSPKTSFPCCSKTNKSVRMCLSSSHEQRDDGSFAKQDGKSYLGEFTPLYKHKGQVFKSNEDIARPPLRLQSDRDLDEENMQPPLEYSQGEKRFSQSCSLWNDSKCQGRVGSSSLECRTINPSHGQLKSADAFRYRAAGKYTVLPEGEIPVGSLPDGSKSSASSRGWSKATDGGRRARSLTDEDFNELRGCIDLGFVFTQDHIPDLCETLPALEVCYAIAHGPISPVRNLEDLKFVSPGSPPISPWKVASPGDQPQQVKTRLRHWAQAVACNLRQAC